MTKFDLVEGWRLKLHIDDMKKILNSIHSKLSEHERLIMILQDRIAILESRLNATQTS